VETFTRARPLVNDPDFCRQRDTHLSHLDLATIDPPIRGLISGFGKLLHCYTLQSCYGHFLPGGQGDPMNLDRLPPSGSTATVRYRIAYVALCIANSDAGRNLLQDLRGVPAIDPDYVQFGCAEWFWERQVNSYALQVEPERFMNRDEARVGYQEALHLQYVRGLFFAGMAQVLEHHLAEATNAPS
jgi:hypothetical protein